MVAASLGSFTAAQCEKLSMPPWIGGQITDSTTPSTMAARAVMMGTKRLPAKKPR